MSIANFVNDLFNIYFWIIIVRIFLTWIPNIDWENQFIKAISICSDLVLNPFRRIVPPMGGLDFSPIIALLFLQFLQFTVVKILFAAGL